MQCGYNLLREQREKENYTRKLEAVKSAHYYLFFLLVLLAINEIKNHEPINRRKDNFHKS